MKSAIGIGALLMDGLGDTIRVSLTEDPEYEIDPCKRLASIGETACSKVCYGLMCDRHCFLSLCFHSVLPLLHSPCHPYM